MMAGSCIGVILLVMVLEGLRRASREYDAFIIRQHAAIVASCAPAHRISDTDSDNKTANVQATTMQPASRLFKPSLIQQLVRALLHMLQFAVAYFVMLLAMYDKIHAIPHYHVRETNVFL